MHPPAVGRWMLSAGAMLLAAASPLAGRDVPYLAGHVNDTAQMIPAEVRQQLEATLSGFERDTGAQVAVLTIDSLDGEVLEDYALKVAQTWKLGRKGVDDGVLLLVARDERKMRIEVGYGLEAKLTDAQCRRILDNVIRPAFRDGAYGRGIAAGLAAITGTIRGQDAIPDAPRSPARQFSSGPLGVQLLAIVIFTVVVGIFSLLALLSKGGAGWCLYVILIVFWTVFPLVFFGSAGLLLAAAWVLGFPIARLWLQGSGAGKRFLKAHPGFTAFAASAGRTGSGGGWRSGGFSGGGGSFGGGGASGGW